MIKIMEQIRADQALAAQQSAAAQEKAISNAQDKAAQLGMEQSNFAAMQNLLRQQQYQQALDAAAKEQRLAETASAGRDIVGPAFDVNAANAAKMASLAGMSGSFAPSSVGFYGAGFDSFNQLNPVKRSKPLNAFQLPDQQGLNIE